MVDAPLLEVYWNSAPVAEAGPDQSVLTSTVVQFDGTGSYDPDFGPNALSYSWDFDVSNGIQVDATGANPTHVYSASGIYTVTLTISDGKTTATDTLTVTASGTDTTPPNVTITQAVLTGTVYDAVFCPTLVVIDGAINVTVTSADGHNGTWESNPVDIGSPSDMLALTASDSSSNMRTVQLSISH
jgi:PKD repeat protein